MTKLATRAPATRRKSGKRSDAEAAGRETGTVRRVLLLLSFLVDHPGASVNTIATHLNLPRSTVYRLLSMLKNDDFAAQHGEDGSFLAGAEMYRLAGRLRANVPYARFAEPLLAQLTSQFNETSILAILEREQLKMFYASTASPADPMRYNIVLNKLEPLVWGATARVLLAHLSPAEIERAIQRKERAPVDGRSINRSELNKSLAEIRQKGFALTHSHRTADAVGVAVPFFGADREVIGDVGFLIPEFRFAKYPLPMLVGALKAAAAEMSRQLGVASARSAR